MNKINQRTELIANLLTIVVIVLIGAIAAQKYFFAAPVNFAADRAPIIGSKVNLPGIEPADQSKTLILALNKSCRFCNESALFYKRLIESAQNKNVKLIAVFPTEAEESKAHLRSLGVIGIDVKQSPLSALQIGSTPTLILTDGKGAVADYWVGQLSPDKEAEVFNKLNFKGENNDE